MRPRIFLSMRAPDPAACIMGRMESQRVIGLAGSDLERASRHGGNGCIVLNMRPSARAGRNSGRSRRWRITGLWRRPVAALADVAVHGEADVGGAAGDEVG